MAGGDGQRYLSLALPLPQAKGEHREGPWLGEGLVLGCPVLVSAS